VGALFLSVTVLAGCGESAQEKAKAEVCAARAEISKQVTKLQGLTLSSSTLNEAKASFEAIKKQLEKIKDAQPNLEPARKEQVKSATETFTAELTTIASGVASSVPSGNLESALKTAEPKIKSALSTLATDYHQALGPINCS
jgi:Tfp pilus assembly protein PilP